MKCDFCNTQTEDINTVEFSSGGKVMMVRWACRPCRLRWIETLDEMVKEYDEQPTGS